MSWVFHRGRGRGRAAPSASRGEQGTFCATWRPSLQLRRLFSLGFALASPSALSSAAGKDAVRWTKRAISSLPRSPDQWGGGVRSGAPARALHGTALCPSGWHGHKAPRHAPAPEMLGGSRALPHVSAPHFSPWHWAEAKHSFSRGLWQEGGLNHLWED